MGLIADRVHHKLTKEFIEDNPDDVVLMRRTKTTTAAGGFKWSASSPLAPQRGRLVMSSNRGDKIERTLPDGKVVLVQGTLIFLPGANVQVGDLLDIPEPDGVHSWIVVSVSTTPPWRTHVELSRHGS